MWLCGAPGRWLFLGFVVLRCWGSAGDHYISGVSGLGDGAGADAAFGVGGVFGAAGCGTAAGCGAAGCGAAGFGVAAGGWGTDAACFFWVLVAAALRAAALRVRVFAAFCPAARCFRVATAFLAATRRLRVRAAFAAAAPRFAVFRLRVAAAFFPALALFLGLISSSVAIRNGLNLKLLVYARPAFGGRRKASEGAPGLWRAGLSPGFWRPVVPLLQPF